MNFLAHLLLSGPNPELALGNFLADMLHPNQYGQLPVTVMEGVRFHQEIDRFTDSHPQVIMSKGRVRDFGGKYAPVLIDVYYDLVISMNWSTYANISFSEFEDQIYSCLMAGMEYVPLPLQDRVQSMVRHQWLRTYITEDGIRDVFRRMARRASKPEVLINSVDRLIRIHPDLDYDFKLFFPDLVEKCNSILPIKNEWIHK